MSEQLVQIENKGLAGIIDLALQELMMCADPAPTGQGPWSRDLSMHYGVIPRFQESLRLARLIELSRARDLLVHAKRIGPTAAPSWRLAYQAIADVASDNEAMNRVRALVPRAGGESSPRSGRHIGRGLIIGAWGRSCVHQGRRGFRSCS